MTERDVLALLGEPEGRHADWLGVGETLYLHESTFQVAFGGDGRVGDIQLCARGPVSAQWRGVELLRTPAEEVISNLSLLGEGTYEEDGYSYCFPGIRLSFWRQCLPGEEADDDEQYRGGRFWDTVNTWHADYKLEIEAAAAARRA